MKPLAIYDLVENKVTNYRPKQVIWANVVNNRYCVEVQYKTPFKGNLLVFDGYNNNHILHTELVDVHYDGDPLDPEDVKLWQEIVEEFIA